MRSASLLFVVRADAVKETAAIMSEFHPAEMTAMLLAFVATDFGEVLPTIAVAWLARCVISVTNKGIICRAFQR